MLEVMDVEVIMMQAKAEIQKDLKRCNISLQYEKGMVILSGSVDSFYKKQLAQEAVKRAIRKNVPPIQLVVKNDLKVV